MVSWNCQGKFQILACVLGGEPAQVPILGVFFGFVKVCFRFWPTCIVVRPHGRSLFDSSLALSR